MPRPGFFQILPPARPALPAGRYTLTVAHQLQAQVPTGADGDLSLTPTRFHVSIVAPRYALPPGQVLSTFPPAGAVGDWRERLPQVVFKRRTLPWERNPHPPKDGIALENAPPWLALVVLAEGEGALSPDVPVAECVTPGVVLGGDGDTARGRYLLVRRSVVQKVFPRKDELDLLCHVRRVDLHDTELALGDDDGDMAVILANRLPQPGAAEDGADDDAPRRSVRYTAYLINVEGQLDALPKADDLEFDPQFAPHVPTLQLSTAVSPEVLAAHGPGAAVAAARASGVEHRSGHFATGPAGIATTAAPLAGAEPSAYAHRPAQAHFPLAVAAARTAAQFDPSLRFPVLLSWDFVCTGTGTFESLMAALPVGLLGTLDEGTPATADIEMAETGHIGLERVTRQGERTRAWYRGPLVPHPTVRLGPNAEGAPLVHAAEALGRLTPDGREDVSRSAAFEIGRLLALSKPSVVSGLMAWRAELFGAARAAELNLHLFGELFESAELRHAVQLGKRALESLVAKRLVAPMVEGIPSRVAPKAPGFATPRVPKALAELSPEATLSGLGLSPDAVKNAAAQGGLAAVARIPVALAGAPAEALSASPHEMESLRAELELHTDRVLQDARPKAGPDALDRLLSGAALEGDL